MACPFSSSSACSSSSPSGSGSGSGSGSATATTTSPSSSFSSSYVVPNFQNNPLFISLSALASRAFSRFFLDGAPKWENFNRLLDEVLELTGCEYGLIGKIVESSAGTHAHEPALKLVAVTNIAWTPALKSLVLPNKLEFIMSRGGLLGETYRTGLSVFSNNPREHPAWKGLPFGHFPLRAFMSVPFYAGNRTGPNLGVESKCLGSIALANRPGGFDAQFVEMFSHFATLVGSLIMLYWQLDYNRVDSPPSSSSVPSAQSEGCSESEVDALSVMSEYFLPEHTDLSPEDPGPRPIASPLYPPATTPSSSSSLHLSSVVSGASSSSSVLRPEVFTSVIDSISDGVLVLNSDQLRIVQCNKAAAKMLGYTRTELRSQGIRFLDLILKDTTVGDDNIESPRRTREDEDIARMETGERTEATEAGTLPGGGGAAGGAGGGAGGRKRRRREDTIDWEASLASEASAGRLTGLNIETNLVCKTSGSSLSLERKTIPVDLALTSFIYNAKVFFSVVFRDVTQEKVFKRKDKLLAFLSHEIRNPLQVIMSGLQMVSDQIAECVILSGIEKQSSPSFPSPSPLPSIPSTCSCSTSSSVPSPSSSDISTLQASLSPLLNMTQQSAEMLFGLMNDTIDFTRIDSQKLVPNIDEVDPCSHIKMAIRQCEPLRSPSVTCNTELSGLPNRIQTDARRMLQVLNNLISNAYKYTPSGSVTIRASWHPLLVASSSSLPPLSTAPSPSHSLPPPPSPYSSSLPFKNHIRVEVIDTGIGISAQDQEKLLSFSLFTQIDSPQRRFSEKTGLGLAIAKHICTAMGGQLSLESRLGVGSTFCVDWPCTILEESQEDESERKMKNTTKSFTNLSTLEKEKENLEGLSILLVDDNPLVRRAVNNMLIREMINCQQGEDGQQALELVFSQPEKFQVILMDCLMPVLDGYSAVRELRKRGATLPVIALTGNSLSEDIEKCKEAGFSDVLVKPVAKQEILQKLAYWRGRTHPSPGE